MENEDSFETLDTNGLGDISQLLGNDINHTALAILYEKLLRNKECLQQQKEPRCEETALYRMLMGYGFLILCFIAIVGNCLNILVYTSDQIRFFIAIKMLCTKLLTNTLTMLVLLPQACRSIGLWAVGSMNDQVYWSYWPYQAFFGNFFGFTGMWLTVLMTAECYVHVFMPLRSKSICTMKNVWRSYVVIVIMATLLGIIYPLNRSVMLTDECDKVEVAIVMTDADFLGIYERFHMLANMLFAIVIPLGLLVFMTSCIVWRLVGKTTLLRDTGKKKVGGKFNSEKRSVTQITIITTIFQLMGELPSVPIFLLASFTAPGSMDKMAWMCLWQTLSQFLGLCNVSLSFFVYIAFSPRFRKALITRLYCGNKYLRAVANSLTPLKRHSNDPSVLSIHCPSSTDVRASIRLIAVASRKDGRLNVDCISPTLSDENSGIYDHFL
uniref:G_PROTEIN_RECEP_F1_2 domain-containing protein n=2 Tax=Bursaphelenchus xylophilus TaxID=6326 RepID=A0A1I7S4W5_BURXY